ncbi:MAG: hypothetical protein IKW42_03855 [Alistipes sp.]|nr:hypothetical protein [Alistipes sp.]
MRYYNVLQRFVAVLSLVMVSYVAAAQSDDVVFLLVDKGGITVAEDYADQVLLFKEDGEVPEYYLYTAAPFTKLRYASKEVTNEVHADVYVNTEDVDVAWFYEGGNRKKPEGECRDNRTIIKLLSETSNTRALGVGDGHDRAMFRIVNINKADKFRLTLCRAESHMVAVDVADTTLLSFGGEVVREQGEGVMTITTQDRAALTKLSVRIPAYTYVKTVRVGSSVAKSYDSVALTETEFGTERSLEVEFEAAVIDSLCAGAELAVTYVGLDDKGVKESELCYAVSYTEPVKPAFERVVEWLKSINWWVYVIIVLAIVLVAMAVIVCALFNAYRYVKSEHYNTKDDDKSGHKDDDKGDDKGDDDKPAKEDKMAELQAKLASAQQALQDREAELKEAQDALTAKDETLNTKEAELTEANRLLNEVKEGLEAATRTIEERDAELARVNTSLEMAQAKLENIETNHQTEIGLIKESHKAVIDTLQMEHQATMEATTTHYETTIEAMKATHTAEVVRINEEHLTQLDEAAEKYALLEAAKCEVVQQWKSDRGQVIEFFESQLHFIDKYLEVIAEKADRNSPIYQLLLQLSTTTYGYNTFRERVITTLRSEERGVADIVEDVRSFVAENMSVEMSWINNAARLYAYASTAELKSIFGHYGDAESHTRQLIDQIKILVAMWGVTDIAIPKLFVTPFSDDEYDYDIANLVLPTLYPDYIDLQKAGIIFDFLRVGFVVGGNKVKPKVAY